MKFPLDTADGGVAFALRCGYEKKVYVKNIGKGGKHYPATSVVEIYAYKEK